MYSSPVELCNSALISLGLNPITSLGPTPEAARICQIKWPESRDTVLQMPGHAWRCLKKRARLARLTAAPAFGFLYTYRLPPDYCQLVSVFNTPTVCVGLPPGIPALFPVGPPPPMPWSIEGTDLLTDAEEVYISYVGYDTSVDNVALFDPLLGKTIVCLLAANVAPSLKSSERADEMMALYKDALSDAQFAGALEVSPTIAGCPTFLSVR